jgi:hypothetical protein
MGAVPKRRPLTNSLGVFARFSDPTKLSDDEDSPSTPPLVQNGLSIDRSSAVGTHTPISEIDIKLEKNLLGNPSRNTASLNDSLPRALNARQPRPTRYCPLKPVQSESEAMLPTMPKTSEYTEEAETPKRRRIDVKKKTVGSNPYGRSGTLRCRLCRKWKRKASLVACEK